MKRWRDDDGALLFPELAENPWRTARRSALDDRSAACADGSLTALELCAGAGGQALGLEQAGVRHESLIELDKNACATLRMNRPKWNVINEDLNDFDGAAFRGVDLIAGGLPCPPFRWRGNSSAGMTSERLGFGAPQMARLRWHTKRKRGLIWQSYADLSPSI